MRIVRCPHADCGKVLENPNCRLAGKIKCCPVCGRPLPERDVRNAPTAINTTVEDVE